MDKSWTRKEGEKKDMDRKGWIRSKWHKEQKDRGRTSFFERSPELSGLARPLRGLFPPSSQAGLPGLCIALSHLLVLLVLHPRCISGHSSDY